MDNKCKHTDIDAPEGSNSSEGCLRKNNLILRPVAEYESGKGLPYAPANWPKPGDMWGWKVGNRTNFSGFWQDRYLYLPTRLEKALQKRRFASKLSVKEYVQREFPDEDIDAFFASFSWRIPATTHAGVKGDTTRSSKKSTEKATERSSKLKVETLDCRVGNQMCRLQLQERKHSLPAMPCDICCSELSFCRDCCCILCCKSVDWAYGSYSFIRCEEKINESYVCGHVAHVDCALNMARMVGGNLGLDVEYYCRRCDKRSDLTVHVTKLLVTCQSLDSREDMEKILNVGLSILHGSKQERCKRLLHRINLALAKLKSGYPLEDVWKVENNLVLSAVAGQISHSGSNGALYGTRENLSYRNQMDRISPWKFNSMQETQQPVVSTHSIEPLNLEERIKKALLDLREAQVSEYTIAKERLLAQKDVVLSLYKQHEAEQSELALRRSSPDCDDDALVASNKGRMMQIKQEVLKLGEMKEVAKGFGRVSKVILNEHFGLQKAD